MLRITLFIRLPLIGLRKEEGYQLLNEYLISETLNWMLKKICLDKN